VADADHVRGESVLLQSHDVKPFYGDPFTGGFYDVYLLSLRPANLFLRHRGYDPQGVQFKYPLFAVQYQVAQMDRFIGARDRVAHGFYLEADPADLDGIPRPAGVGDMHRIQSQATFQRHAFLIALMGGHHQIRQFHLVDQRVSKGGLHFWQRDIFFQQVFIEVGIDPFYPDRVQVQAMGS